MKWDIKCQNLICGQNWRLTWKGNASLHTPVVQILFIIKGWPPSNEEALLNVLIIWFFRICDGAKNKDGKFIDFHKSVLWYRYSQT